MEPANYKKDVFSNLKFVGVTGVLMKFPPSKSFHSIIQYNFVGFKYLGIYEYDTCNVTDDDTICHLIS